MYVFGWAKVKVIHAFVEISAQTRSVAVAELVEVRSRLSEVQSNRRPAKTMMTVSTMNVPTAVGKASAPVLSLANGAAGFHTLESRYRQRR